ncbi:hypothetical protein CUMW_083540 [Citrus unshiu]|nr:hypothetical protein CUMW_083540 [Citrus unshiu]
MPRALPKRARVVSYHVPPGPLVSKLGFGCMSRSGGYSSPVFEEDGISIIKHAFNKGITLFF